MTINFSKRKMNMKFNKILFASAFATALTLISCADDYKDINKDPANVTVTDPKGLMAQAVMKFQPNDYLLWFYNVNYLTRWDQMATPTGSYSESFTEMRESGGQGSQYLETLRCRNEIRKFIDKTGDETQRGYEAACTVLTVYLGLFDSDMYGSLPYTEACQYDNGITTPKYNTVEELYKVFLEELDQAVKYFTDANSESTPREDQIYNGDWKKWAKLANSLKLKIAVRLYNNDQAKALEIAKAVVVDNVGYLDELSDDMLFCKAVKAGSDSNNDYVYGTGNGLATPGLSQNVLNYFLACKDPRVRFIYTKNSLNSKVIQGFIDNKTFDKLPQCIKDVVVLDEKGNFKEWGGMGEPWVRYQGLPVVYDGHLKDEYKQFFKYGNDYQLPAGDGVKDYYPFSYQTPEMKKGREDFTLPTVGKEKVIQDTEDNPLYTMYLTSAEVNLYLAEFKLLGADLPKSAEEYYNKGVQLSVQEYDALAKNNKIPYYGETYGYDPNEKPIDLQKDELDVMMATPAIKLTGSKEEQLEKVYLQQLVHFSLLPDDQFVTSRRSGYPKIGSDLLPFVKFDEVVLEAIPRRFEIASPSPTDLMFDNKMEAYKQQGFNTLGTNNSGSAFNNKGTALNTERLWQDKNAPQWGTPKGE